MSASFSDHFSQISKQYQKYRPDYPEQLYQIILKHTTKRQMLWDAGCGTGQVLKALGPKFENCYGSDASEDQIGEAKKHLPQYRLASEMAEACSLQPGSCSLITVAQALHWFKRESFFQKVRTVGDKRAMLAVWCYGLHELPEHLNDVLLYFYERILGDYWPPQRRLIDSGYQDIQFPFRDVTYMKLKMKKEMNLHTYLGYVNTWSAIQAYRIKHNDHDPLDLYSDSLLQLWTKPEEQKIIQFPLHLYLMPVH